MTLVQELEIKRRNNTTPLTEYEAGVDDAITLIHAFADKLEGEEMAIAVGRVLNERANKDYNLYMLGKDESIALAKAALAVVRERLG